jgi:hypothetical protein
MKAAESSRAIQIKNRFNFVYQSNMMKRYDDTESNVMGTLSMGGGMY